MRDFRDLMVWEKAHSLVLSAYRESKNFPSDERFGLTSQFRRAAASIPTNIAEGCGRSADGDLRRFLDIAMGSASETEYLALLSHDLGFLEQSRHEEFSGRVSEVKRMLAAFLRNLRSR